MNDKDKILICELFEKQLDDKITQEEADTLEKMVLNDSEAQDFYFDLTIQNAGLEDQKLALGSESSSVRSESKKTAISFVYKISLAACLLFGLLLGYLSNLQSTQKLDHIAVLENAENSRWSQGTLATANGSLLTAGFLKLEEGVANLRFNSGVVVQLEAPTHIELLNDMHCVVHLGTALADVPEQGKGFRIDTPAAEIIDHGTRFVVSHRPGLEDSSYVEVLEGEIEVKGVEMTKSSMFTEGKRLLAAKSELTSIDSEDEIDWGVKNEVKNAKVIILTTADGNGTDHSLYRATSTGKKYKQINFDPSMVMIKSSECDYARKGYLKFDLSSIPKEKLNSVSLNLTTLDIGAGIAAFVGDSTFDVFAVKDGALDNWKPETVTWLDAPGAKEDSASVNTDQATLVGSFELLQGVYKNVTLESEKLKEAVLNDSNQSLTLIIVRRTKEFERGGLVHAFAGAKSKDHLPPALHFTYSP